MSLRSSSSVHTIILSPPKPTRSRSQGAQQQQLAARKGSATASDPYGKHATSQARGSLSRLTIVKVPPHNEPADDSGGRRPGRRLVRQGSGSGANVRTQSPGGRNASPSSPSRMSFASATFSPPGRAQSPPTAGGRPAFHRRSSSSSSMAASFERLSPNRVYELAKQSPRPSAIHSGPSSFTELNGVTFLPFVDRATEVRELVSCGANAKVMTLLSQLLVSSSDAMTQGCKLSSAAHLASAPERWSFLEFVFWLTRVSRADAVDTLWVSAMRRAVLPRSEVLWERLKGMLGIPVELDTVADTSEATHKATEMSLNVTLIRPMPPSPGLEDISEAAEADEATSNQSSSVCGIRLMTTLAFPTGAQTPSTLSPPSSPPLRLRTTSQGSQPTKSSPLAHKFSTTVIPQALPAPTFFNLATGNSEEGGKRETVDRARIARPYPKPSRAGPDLFFPSSFDKLSVAPRVLYVR